MSENVKTEIGSYVRHLGANNVLYDNPPEGVPSVRAIVIPMVVGDTPEETIARFAPSPESCGGEADAESVIMFAQAYFIAKSGGASESDLRQIEMAFKNELDQYRSRLNAQRGGG